MKTVGRFIGGVLCSFIVMMFIASSVKAADEVFPICSGWDTWVKPEDSGSIKVNCEDWSNHVITLSGKFTTDAGYVVERKLDFGGKTLTLEISGTKDCTFDSGKLFKLEVNGNALIPIEKGRKNVNDPDFINPGDGSVSFKLPENVKKIEFVFWKADLKNLKISGKLSPQQ